MQLRRPGETRELFRRLEDKTEVDMDQVFISWSGGKDCCLACYRAIANGMDVRYLASMITKDTGRLWPHFLSPETLRMQAQAIGFPIVMHLTDVPDYDTEYKKMLQGLKEKGITGGVFGDVNVGNGLARKHLQWVDSVCRPMGITPHRPLWNETRESIITDFIDSGFKAIIIAADDKLGKEYLGRDLDRELLWELKRRHELSPTGEVGYYHTFVTDGPLFKERLEILETNQVMRVDRVRRDGIWYLDILKCGLKPKVPERSPMTEQLVLYPT